MGSPSTATRVRTGCSATSPEDTSATSVTALRSGRQATPSQRTGCGPPGPVPPAASAADRRRPCTSRAVRRPAAGVGRRRWRGRVEASRGEARREAGVVGRGATGAVAPGRHRRGHGCGRRERGATVPERRPVPVAGAGERPPPDGTAPVGSRRRPAAAGASHPHRADAAPGLDLRTPGRWARSRPRRAASARGRRGGRAGSRRCRCRWRTPPPRPPGGWPRPSELGDRRPGRRGRHAEQGDEPVVERVDGHGDEEGHRRPPRVTARPRRQAASQMTAPANPVTKTWGSSAAGRTSASCRWNQA